MPDVDSIRNAVRDYIKDGLRQKDREIDNAIKATCIELSTVDDDDWNVGTVSLTVPTTKTDFMQLPRNYHTMIKLYVPNVPASSYLAHFNRIDERDFIMRSPELVNTQEGYYRQRWEESPGLYTIALVNGPEAGTTVEAVYRKMYTDVFEFPPFMEEAIILGAAARMLILLDGEDTEYGLLIQSRYAAQQAQHFSRSTLKKDQPKRVKGYLDIGRENNQYVRTTT